MWAVKKGGYESKNKFEALREEENHFLGNLRALSEEDNEGWKTVVKGKKVLRMGSGMGESKRNWKSGAGRN